MLRITRIGAEGFRSLDGVEIDTDRPFNVFYGENGAGKSNILEAARTAILMAAYRAKIPGEHVLEPLSPAGDAPIGKDDRTAFRDTPRTTLWLDVRASDGESLFTVEGREPVIRLEFNVSYAWTTSTVQIELNGVGTEGNAGTVEDLLNLGAVRPIAERKKLDDALRYFFAEKLPRLGFAFVGADRYPGRVSADGQDDVAALLRKGKLIPALAKAERNLDDLVRQRVSAFRSLMEGAPFHRSRFEIIDVEKDVHDLREPIKSSPGAFSGKSVSLEHAGLGIAQVYSIIAQIVLSGARAAGIEEPEAHLHGPTSGRHLRQLLVRLVDEGIVDQLFIATHGNLFDLDPEGYHDVRFEPAKGTMVSWAKPTSLDVRHLYEPGPAKRALEEFLRTMGDEDIGLRRPDGSEVTTKEMIELLRRGDDDALTFLDELHAAAVRLAMIRQKKHRGE